MQSGTVSQRQTIGMLVSGFNGQAEMSPVISFGWTVVKAPVPMGPSCVCHRDAVKWLKWALNLLSLVNFSKLRMNCLNWGKT